MLARTANDLFWLSRYIERAENMARLIEVGYRIVLLPRDGEGFHEEWRATLESAGCLNGYLARHGELETRAVINYMMFDLDNQSSIASCIANARRNARAQRTSMTRDMWESLNSAWLEFSNIRPASITADSLPELIDWVRSQSALYRGTLLNTILRNDTFHFSQAGTFIERADNTSRILDVKYYHLLPSSEMVGGEQDNFQWTTILRSVSAHRSYRWVYHNHYRPVNIVAYLILNRHMPRSLRACYDELVTSLEELAGLYGKWHDCHRAAAQTRDHLIDGDIGIIFQNGLHEYVQDFIARNNALGVQISDAYHLSK